MVTNMPPLRSLAVLLYLILATDLAQSQERDCAVRDPGFRAFLSSFERGIDDFINGDPALWKRNASRRDDAMIMGAWGAYEKGWQEVDARYDWAAARFEKSGAKAQFEYLSCAVSGNLGYSVAIERSVDGCRRGKAHGPAHESHFSQGKRSVETRAAPR
jgi:hypothetical protein